MLGSGKVAFLDMIEGDSTAHARCEDVDSAATILKTSTDECQYTLLQGRSAICIFITICYCLRFSHRYHKNLNIRYFRWRGKVLLGQGLQRSREETFDKNEEKGQRKRQGESMTLSLITKGTMIMGWTGGVYDGCWCCAIRICCCQTTI